MGGSSRTKPETKISHNLDHHRIVGQTGAGGLYRHAAIGV
jgi:hypothetical protein